MKRKNTPFKYKLAFLFSMITLMTAITMGIFHYINIKANLTSMFSSYRLLVKNSIYNTIADTDQLYITVEKMLDPQVEKILREVSKDYARTKRVDLRLENYIKNNKEFNLYIIDSKNKIINATEKIDIGLDFNYNPSFIKELNYVRSSGKYYSQRFSQSVNMREVRKYNYLASDDRRYIFELGYKITDYIDYVKGISFANIEKKLVNINNALKQVIVYDPDGIAYKKDSNKKYYQVDEKNKKYFKQAKITMNTVEYETRVNGERLVYQYVPYKLIDAKSAGYVVVAEIIYSYDWLDKRVSKNISILVTLLILVTLVSVAFGIYISRIVSRPIESMVKDTKEYAGGNYSHRSIVRTYDEFSILSQSLNHMARNIRGREEELNLKNMEVMEKSQEIAALYEETAAMNDSLEELMVENNKNYIEVISSLCSAIEAKDAYTRGHSERVKDVSIKIAKAMKLSAEDLMELERGSILHDVGKIGIPEKILNKTSKLDDEEYDIIKRHPGIGYEILKDIHFLRDGIEIVKQHHERYDGKGYPKGLKGEEISILARIVCVADAYDAMTSGRSYRKVPLDVQVAKTEIVNNSGTQFDPLVVEVFTSIFDEINEKD